MFEIRPNPRTRFRFDYLVAWTDRSGERRERPAYLTYEIARQRRERRVLLINWTGSDIPPEFGDQRSFRALAGELRQHQTKVGNITAAKRVTNRIMRAESVPPAWRVSTHRFGPVPSFKVGDQYTLPKTAYPEAEAEVEVMLYPMGSVSAETARNYRGAISANRAEFITCITWDLETLFRRYFEDVAVAMHSLEHFAGPTDIFPTSKNMEWRVGESVKTKLDALITPPPESADLELKEVFERAAAEHAVTIETGEVGRHFALFAINELYGILQIRRKDEYAAFLRNLEPKPGRSRETQALKNASVAYLSEQPIPSADGLEDWCAGFIKFLNFISLLRQGVKTFPNYQFLAGATISSDSTDAFTKRALDAMHGFEQAATFRWPGLAAVEATADPALRRALSWLCFSHWGFFETDPLASSASAMTTRGFLAHSLHIQRRVNLGAVKPAPAGGACLFDVLDDANPPSADTVTVLGETLAGKRSGLLPLPASPAGQGAQQAFIDRAEADEAARFTALLYGYLESLELDYNDRQVLSLLRQRIGGGIAYKRSQIAEILNPGDLDAGERQFDLVRGKCYRRGIIIDGVEFKVFSRKRGRHAYYYRLPEIFRKFYVGFSDFGGPHDALQAWLDRE